MYTRREDILYLYVHTTHSVCIFGSLLPPTCPPFIFKCGDPHNPLRTHDRGKRKGAMRTQRSNRTQLPGVVVCLVVNNLKHCFHMNANKQKKGGGGNHKDIVCYWETTFSSLQIPKVSVHLSLHLGFWAELRSTEYGISERAVSRKMYHRDWTPVAHKFNLKCNSDMEIHSSFQYSSWHSRKFLESYSNVKTRECNAIKTTRWPDFLEQTKLKYLLLLSLYIQRVPKQTYTHFKKEKTVLKF